MPGTHCSATGHRMTTKQGKRCGSCLWPTDLLGHTLFPGPQAWAVCAPRYPLVGLLGSWTDQVGGGRRVCFSQMATQTAVKEDKALVTTRERAQDQFALSFSSSASSEGWWGSCFSGPQGAESQHSPPCVTASPNRLGAPLGQGPCLTPLSAQRGIWHLLMLSKGFRKCKEFVSKL